MTRSFWLPAVLAIVAALVLLLGVAAGWVDVTDQRDVGGVDVTERSSLPGTQFVPGGVSLALAAFGWGVVLAVVRGKARRTAAVVVVLLGVGCVAAVGVGIARLSASAQPGTPTPAPLLSLLAGGAVVVAGALALRAPVRPPPASRYRVESEKPADEEWALATDEPNDQ